MKKLTLEQLTNRMGSLCEGQNVVVVVGSTLSLLASALKASDSPQLINATAITLLKMMELLKEQAEALH